MSTTRPLRVMWLLNHGAARKFEVPMLKRIGINEIFLPKIYPDDPSFRSASVDFSEDENLTVPSEDLAILNETDWYGAPSQRAWDIANEHFDVLFFILHYPNFISSMSRYFKGLMIWRTYGREIEMNYDSALRTVTRTLGPREISALGDRFFFGMAYEHLDQVEPDYIQRRAVYLPLGLHDCSISDNWEGSDPRMLFVCPDIEANQYYTKVYKDFEAQFGDLPHVIGGVQSIRSERPNVLGYLRLDEYERNMRQLRVMYYHSLEPNHIHYHPFEAIKAGMPLVFRAGGLLDRLGGERLPGRVTSIRDARNLIKRLLNSDASRIENIRRSQAVLLDKMKPDYCEPFWRSGFAKITEVLRQKRSEPSVVNRPKRIAVLLPLAYRGGSFNAAKLIAEAVQVGSRQAGAEAKIILGYPDDGGYSNDDFSDLPTSVARRPFHWRRCSMVEARRAMVLAGHSTWTPYSENFLIAEDGINNFADADVWVVISDRVTWPLLPLKPIVSVVYDFVQRYFKLWDKGRSLSFLLNNWYSSGVLVTTNFTRQDAIQYAGLSPDRVKRVPMLIPRARKRIASDTGNKATTFLWATNASPHKNHGDAIEALSIYFQELDGALKCIITGVDSDLLLNGKSEHLQGVSRPLKRLIKDKKVKLKGNLSDAGFASELSRSAFLWHPARVDNGTFSVVEAAYAGVPSLSSDYPAMREMDEELSLGLIFSSTDSPRAMALRLKWMEENFEISRERLPTQDTLEKHTARGVGRAYWEELVKFL